MLNDDLTNPWIFALGLAPVPLSIGLTAGLVGFGFSWLIPALRLPRSRAQFPARFLCAIGVVGALLLTVTTLGWASESIAWRVSLAGDSALAWISRSSGLLVTVLVLLCAAYMLRRAARREFGSRSVAPRQPWHALTPNSLIWLGAALAALIVAVALWQTSFAGNPRTLPELTKQGSGEVVHVGGAAIAPASAFVWGTHGPVLLCLAAVLAAAIWALSLNGQRATVSVQERALVARVVAWVVLSALLLACGTALVHVWVPAEWVAAVEGADGSRGDFLGSNLIGLKLFANGLGWAAQGLGLALLVRLALESARSLWLPRKRGVRTAALTRTNLEHAE